MRKLALAAVLAASLVFAGAAGAIATKLVKVTVDDVVVVQGTNVGCTVVKLGTQKLMTCAKVDAKGGLPGSYGISIDKKRVVVCKFDTKRDCDPVFSANHWS